MDEAKIVKGDLILDVCQKLMDKVKGDDGRDEQMTLFEVVTKGTDSLMSR